MGNLSTIRVSRYFEQGVGPMASAYLAFGLLDRASCSAVFRYKATWALDRFVRGNRKSRLPTICNG